MATKERSAFQRKLDSISRAIFLTEDGKPKSTVLMYSFCFSLLFAIVYVVCYWVLVGPLESLFSKSSVRVQQIIEYIVPAVVATVPCVLLSFAFRERKNMVLLSFIWFDVIVVVFFIMEIFIADKAEFASDYGLFFVVLGIPMLISGFLGTVCSLWVFKMRKAF